MRNLFLFHYFFVVNIKTERNEIYWIINRVGCCCGCLWSYRHRHRIRKQNRKWNQNQNFVEEVRTYTRTADTLERVLVAGESRKISINKFSLSGSSSYI